MQKPIFHIDDERQERAVSRHELRRYHAGELGEARRREIAALLETDAELQAELAALEADDRAFRAAMPFERFARDHEARRAQASALAPLRSFLSRFRFQAGGLVVATAAALLLVVLLPEGRERPYDGLKGGARLGFFVKEESGARIGADGEVLRPGDRIQFAVKDDERARSMVLVGVDGLGNVTTYVASRLPPKSQEKGEGDGKPRLLEQSLVLDDAEGAERFFVVYGDEEPAALQAVAERAAKALLARGRDLARAERLALGEEHPQSSVHIVKVR